MKFRRLENDFKEKENKGHSIRGQVSQQAPASDSLPSAVSAGESQQWLAILAI
jgi:hypothetical protein